MADRALHHAAAIDRPYCHDGDLVAAWIGDRGMFVNAAIVVAPPDDWDGLLERVGAVIPMGTTATLISPFATPDLSDRGWALIGHPPLMARMSGAASANAPAIPAELRIHEVVDRDGLEVFERTLIEGYPMPDMLPYEWGGFLDERVLGGATRFWIGDVDGEPVATAVAHGAAGVNDVEMIATVDAFRGKGYGAAVTWAATTADPALPAILIASDLGRRVYEGLGYTALTRWTMWMRP